MALSLRSPSLRVTEYPALWSPDFPLFQLESWNSDHPVYFGFEFSGTSSQKRNRMQPSHWWIFFPSFTSITICGKTCWKHPWQIFPRRPATALPPRKSKIFWYLFRITISTRSESFFLFASKPSSSCLTLYSSVSFFCRYILKCSSSSLHFFSTPGTSLAFILSLIHIWRCRRIERCWSRWSPYH